jgi:hypothetical protein
MKREQDAAVATADLALHSQVMISQVGLRNHKPAVVIGIAANSAQSVRLKNRLPISGPLHANH